MENKKSRFPCGEWKTRKAGSPVGNGKQEKQIPLRGMENKKSKCARRVRWK
jgi:hypothetical protein